MEAVAGRRAAGFHENVDVAVTVPIPAGDAVALLQMPGAGRRGDLGKALAFNVLEHAVGHQHVVGRVASAEIEIEIAVVVEVRKVEGKRSEEHTSELQSRVDLVCR